MQGHSVFFSSLFNLNHRISHVFPSAMSPRQDVNPFSGRCPQLERGPCPLEPGIWGWGWLSKVNCPSLPGIPAQIPGLHISLVSEEALFRGRVSTMALVIYLHSASSDVNLTIFCWEPIVLRHYSKCTHQHYLACSSEPLGEVDVALPLLFPLRK